MDQAIHLLASDLLILKVDLPFKANLGYIVVVKHPVCYGR